MVGLEYEHGAVEQTLIARQGDCDFGAALRGRAKAMPRKVTDSEGHDIDRAMMFQPVNPLGERRIKAAAEHLLDPQHRLLPRRLLNPGLLQGESTAISSGQFLRPQRRHWISLIMFAFSSILFGRSRSQLRIWVP